MLLLLGIRTTSTYHLISWTCGGHGGHEKNLRSWTWRTLKIYEQKQTCWKGLMSFESRSTFWEDGTNSKLKLGLAGMGLKIHSRTRKCKQKIQHIASPKPRMPAPKPQTNKQTNRKLNETFNRKRHHAAQNGNPPRSNFQQSISMYPKGPMPS